MKTGKIFYPDLGYEICWDPMPDEIPGWTENIADLVEELFYEAQQPVKKTFKKLESLVVLYPAIPQFWNYLVTAHLIKGNLAEAEITNLRCLKVMPDYLFAKLNKVAIYFSRDKYEKIPEVIADFDDLRKLQPGRLRFHIAEVMSFYKLAAKYYVKIEEFDKALAVADLMDRIDAEREESENVRKMMMPIILKKTFYNLSKKFENRINVKAKALPYNVDREFPVFYHPEVRELYDEDLYIEDETIEKILNLPSETLIADLITLIWDAINRYHYFKSEDYVGNIDFCSISMLFLAELKARESLPVIFDFLSQDDDFLNFWLEDLLTEEVWSILYKICLPDFAPLVEFIKKPGVECYSKSAASEAMAHYVIIHPEKKQELINLYSDLINFFIKEKSKPELFDTTFLDFLVNDISEIKGAELKNQIKELYELDMIRDYDEDSLNELFLDMGNLEKRPHLQIIPTDIFHHYQIIRDKFSPAEQYDETEESETETNLGLDNKDNNNEPFDITTYQSPLKTGRNDPCPCGSGKKYKKCCMI